MNVNIPYEDTSFPVLGPQDPFRTPNRLDNQNALAGHVEEHAMTACFPRSTSHSHSTLTQHILGYSANPSMGPNSPAFLGNAEAAAAYGLATVDTLRALKEKRKNLKRKRKYKGDLDVVDGDGSYVGPWAGWEGGDLRPQLPEGVEEEADEVPEPEPELAPKKGRNKRGVPGQETSTFHGKQMTDYQGRTYISPPLVEAPHIVSEPGLQETFIPKTCVHSHTQGVSVVWFPVFATAHSHTYISYGTYIPPELAYARFSNDGPIRNGKTPYVIRFHPMTSRLFRRFVTTSYHKTIRAGDYDIPVVIKYIAEPHMHSMPAVTLHPSKKYFAAQSLDNQILVYSTDNFRQNRKKRFAGHTVAGYACQVGFSPDGKWISSGDGSGNVVF
ncbi:hypothetical protein JB92DRAFT_2830568 [Gautieria morchelliformis]|nr:hypothetical protein JB92DRAFT_2830568 [Gautieria morchelliformis]